MNDLLHSCDCSILLMSRCVNLLIPVSHICALTLAPFPILNDCVWKSTPTVGLVSSASLDPVTLRIKAVFPTPASPITMTQ